MELLILAIFFFTECREGTGSNTELLLYTLNAYIIYLLIPNLNYYVRVIIPKAKMCMLFSTFAKAFVFLVNTFLVQKLLLEEISSLRIWFIPLNTAIYMVSFYLHALLKNKYSHIILSVFLIYKLWFFWMFYLSHD